MKFLIKKIDQEAVERNEPMKLTNKAGGGRTFTLYYYRNESEFDFVKSEEIDYRDYTFFELMET